MRNFIGLIEFKDQRIEALSNKLSELRQENERLINFIAELCDEDCPEDYKRVVLKNVLGGMDDNG